MKYLAAIVTLIYVCIAIVSGSAAVAQFLNPVATPYSDLLLWGTFIVTVGVSPLLLNLTLSYWSKH